MLKIELFDDIYPKKEITHTRYIARGFLVDENNNLSILSISRDDVFGKASYIESSGGGIEEGENKENAILREIQEETGFKSHIIKEVATIIDYYNLINRRNYQYYFLLKKEDFVGQHFASEGDLDIKKLRFLDIDSLIKEYESYLGNKDISSLVARKRG